MKILMSAICAMAAVCWAGPIEDSARRVLSDYGEAVMPVTAVLKVEAPGASAPQERNLEFLGTVVASNGLMAVSATTLSPFNNMGDAASVGGSRPTTSASRIKIRFSDGIEVPARQVLTDEDADLTFLLPEPEEGKPAPKFPKPVEFAPGVAANVADELFTVGRAGDLFGWAPVLGRLHIIGRVERPRRHYLIAGAFSPGVGAPVFLSDGRPLGLLVVRREPAEPQPGRPAPFQQAIVVLPSETVADLVEQALHTANNSSARRP